MLLDSFMEIVKLPTLQKPLFLYLSVSTSQQSLNKVEILDELIEDHVVITKDDQAQPNYKAQPK